MEYAIDVQGLCKSFDQNRVVDQVNLQVKTGEVYGFLGPNGSGKTTTLRMICGLLQPDSGTGHCLGYDILTESYQIKCHIGYMTQHFSLYRDLTCIENLDFIARIYQLDNRQQRISAILNRLNFGTARSQQLAGNLSGGWQQRLALAGALIHNPKVLLLDEPTAGVDPAARREFWDTIHDLSTEGITTLVTTHYMDEAERCNHLAYLSYGKLLVQGSEADIITHAGLITFEVTGDKLSTLAQQLRRIDCIEQVATFGSRLHVSGTDITAIKQAIKPFQQAWHWQQIPASLEDVFIYYMGQANDNFA